MFILPTSQFASFDLAQAPVFVAFWRQFYSYRVKREDTNDSIEYFDELNLGRPLTRDNVLRLLRWKDRRLLSQVIKSGTNSGRANPRVAHILNHIDDLNAFRAGDLTEQAFLRVVEGILQSGSVWRGFLLHICRPTLYPIVDQHVYRSFEWHTGDATPDSWDKYSRYRVYFGHVADATYQTSVDSDAEHLARLKRVDDALMSFGQFLAKYGKRVSGNS